MRRPTHDIEARFRINGHLIASAKARAEQQGMTLSELIRQALRRELQDEAA